MLYKHMFALLVVTSSIVAMDQKPVSLDDVDLNGMTLAFSRSHVRSRENVDLLCDENGFIVREGTDLKRVQRHDTDPLFRRSNLRTIAKYGALNNFKVTKFDNGEYAVQPNLELRGGGAGGATLGAIIGKGLVHFVGHGVIQIVAVCSGPAYPATVLALEAALLPTVIEPLSNAAAIAGGVIGGVATGPV